MIRIIKYWAGEGGVWACDAKTQLTSGKVLFYCVEHLVLSAKETAKCPTRYVVVLSSNKQVADR